MLRVVTFKRAFIVLLSFIFILFFISQFAQNGKPRLDLLDANTEVNLFNNKPSSEDLELAKNLNDLTERLLDQQDKRLEQLENDRNKLERQLQELRRPSSDSTLREKLAFIYPYDQNQKFPAYVWQTWKYGLNDDRFGQDYKKGEEQWAVKNPGFVHELFNDDTSNAIIRYLYMNIPEVVKAYESMPHILLKMDFFRYLILYAKGGVYADVDTLPLQPIPNWIPENVDPSELGMIIGIESDPVNKDWRQHYTRRLQFANWVIQAKPGHPIIREMIASVTENTLKKSASGNLKLSSSGDINKFMLDVMDWTGDGVWTDVIFKYFNDYVLSGVFSKVTWKDFTKMEVPKLVSDVLVLPVNSFAAGYDDLTDESENAVKGDESHPLAFVKHYKSKVFDQV